MTTRATAAANYPILGQMIGGELLTGGGRTEANVTDPTTGTVLGQYPVATNADLDAALAAAKRGFDVWRRTSAFDRAKVLRKTADLMRASASELAELIVLELGKPWAEAIAEVEQAAGMWEWAAEEGRRLYGRLIPAREDHARQMVMPEPVGPVAAFGSWNAPLITPSRKMSGALAAGCSMVFKASEEVPACALAIVRIAHEAGLPGDVLSVVIGDAEHVSMRLLDSQVIRCVTFTGSTRVGKILSVRAVEQMKRPVMELGGHAPVLVFDDVDPRTVARAAAAAKFRNSGQICIAPTRFFVQRRIYEDFVGALGEAADRLVPGCGFDPETTMGPLVHPRRVEAIADLVQDARSRGHRIVAGGNALDRPGSFHAPTVVADVTTETRAANIEPFGPLALVAPFDTYDEAIHLANRLPMALAAYVQTKNVHTALRAIDDIEAGSVIANGWRVSLPETPFGGHKDSGFGQEGGIEGLQAFLNIKFGYLR